MQDENATHLGLTDAQDTVGELPRIAGFTALERISKDSACTFYKARQDRLGRLVVLKTMPEWPPPSDVALERFNRSIYAYSQIVQSNVPVLYETGTQNGFHYASLEYIDGITLQQLLTEKGSLSERRALSIALQVARALKSIHEKRLIHRNVKPKNILLTRDGKAYLVGFGLTKCDAPCFSAFLDARTIGTPHYMAPEIIRGCCTDPRSDLYSLGVTMYVMATGKPPFEKGIPAAVMAKHLYEQPESLKTLRPDLSHDFIQLVRALMAKCPHERPDSTATVVSRLEVLTEESFQRSESQRLPRRTNFTRWIDRWLPTSPRSAAAILFSLAFVASLATGMLGLGLWMQQQPEKIKPVHTHAGKDNASHVPAASISALPLPAAAQQALLELRAREAYFRTSPELGIVAWQRFLSLYPDLKIEERLEAEYNRRQLQDLLQPLKPAVMQPESVLEPAFTPSYKPID